MKTTRLLISCPDRPGIVARVAGFLADADKEHHRRRPALDRREPPVHAARVRGAPEGERGALYSAAEVAEPLDAEHRFAEANRMPKVALMASREDHCLLDLLWRFRSDELPGEPRMVIANHPIHEDAVRSFATYRSCAAASLMSSAARRSTSTTAVSRPSPAPIPTAGPGSGA